MTILRALVLCGLSLILTFANCSKKRETPVQEKKSITIWWAQWAPADGLQELGNDFEKEAGIAVKVHQIPWISYQDQVFLNFGNKQTDFDVVVGQSAAFGSEKEVFFHFFFRTVGLCITHRVAFVTICFHFQ